MMTKSIELEGIKGHLGEWSNNKSSRRAIHRVLEQVCEVSIAERVRKKIVSIPRLEILTPRIPAISDILSPEKRSKQKGCTARSILSEDIKREGATWVSIGKSSWRGNKELLHGFPAASRLPPNWKVNNSDFPGRSRIDGKLRIRDVTEDKRSFQYQIAADFSVEVDSSKA